MREKEFVQKESSEMRKSTELFDFSAFLNKANQLPHGEPITYGATPLDRVTTLNQQLSLAVDLQELTYRDIPDDVPMEIIDYVHTTFATRFHSRAEANEENYMTALNSESVFSLEVLEMFRRGELGQATPSELLLTRELRGIRSVELACLTHPYGKRITDTPYEKNMLTEMREVVQEHVELLGGVYYDEPETRYRVKEIVGYEKGEEKLDKAVLMTRKRTIGEMPDGTIIRERSSFVLRLDDGSPFTKEDIEFLNSIDISEDGWQDALVKAGKLDEVAKVLLLNDEFSLAIPISTTIYAYNSETAEAIEARDARLLAERKAAFAKEHPILAAAMNNVTDNARLHRVAEFRGDIFYVGPTTPSNEKVKLEQTAEEINASLDS